MSLRKEQSKAYFKDETKETNWLETFALPGEEHILAEVHAILSIENVEEAFSGKVYLSDAFLTFQSLDKRSCRLTLPLATIRRVEKIAPGQAGTASTAFALGFTLFHGLRIAIQLNSLRPTNDAFCATLRTRLKANLPLMKSLKPFSKTFYSEHFLSETGGPPVEQEKSPEPLLIDIDEKGKGKANEDGAQEWTTRSGIDGTYHGGLGLVFKFPGDARKLRDKSKMKLWKDYFRVHGRNLTLIRYPAFNRLVQVGLPNKLRGELWELTCGSMYLRMQNPGLYERILKENEGRRSASTEDIEKDLHRSLPEYAAYQDSRGIDTMRRVLTAYAWSQPDIGYCQAMNLVVASLLIYMSEEQCFWCLSVLCDRLLPGYYHPSMYGTVLDQRVFEHLVQRCLPMLSEHFATNDIQLSVASLPWFLSCYISSFPMVFAFRIIDCFFLMGPRVLFQVALAILKINAEALLEATDDGAFINILRTYSGTLGDPAYPDARESRTRQITRFQELLMVAFREFSIITDDMIASERRRFRSEVVVSIEDFAKRGALRNLTSVGRLDKIQLGLIYDNFQLAHLKSRNLEVKTSASSRRSTRSSFEAPSQTADDQRTERRLNRPAFGILMSNIATWARDERVVRNGFHEHIEREEADHDFIDRIFVFWDTESKGVLSLQDIVTGLDGVLFNDLMSNIGWLFAVHDHDKDGYLTKDEVLQLSESLLFIFRNEPGDRYLGSISNLLQNLFEYAEATAPQTSNEKPADGEKRHGRSNSIVSENPHRPYLGLATLRMCILADPLLEDFFESDLTKSWRLEVLIKEERPKTTGATGWLGGLVSAVLTDENKSQLFEEIDRGLQERFNRLADDIGRRLEIQTVEQLPSLGKLDAASAALEPQARDSLFSTAKKAPGAAIPASTTTSSEAVNPLSAAAMRQPAWSPAPPRPTVETTDENPWRDVQPASARGIDVQAAARALEQREQFVIDDATADDDDDGRDENLEDDRDLLAQVDNMLGDDNAGSSAATTEAAQRGQNLFASENAQELI